MRHGRTRLYKPAVGDRARIEALALVMECHTGELFRWQLARTGKATTAAVALEQALIARFGTLCNARHCQLGSVLKTGRPDQTMGMKTPAKAHALARLTCLETAGSSHIKAAASAAATPKCQTDSVALLGC